MKTAENLNGHAPSSRALRGLVVERDEDYREVIGFVAGLSGASTDRVSTHEEAVDLSRHSSYDFVVVGTSTGEELAIEFLAELRRNINCPIIVLDESFDEARTRYEAGADQILAKPFVPGALIGAIKAALRGPSPNSVVPVATEIKVRGVTFDAATRSVRHGRLAASLSRREWQLLSFFLANTNRYYEARDVIDQVWSDEISTEQFRSYVTRIRRKLEPLRLPFQLVTRPGIGYALAMDLAPVV
ncbi:MAG TPA: response regulator transcription factor [Candidatus Dormibacteraeota bacterium]